VLAVGAKPGVVFEPSPWEDIFVANAYADKGDLEGARALIAAALEKHPDAWQGFFNAGCLEARSGDPERAFDYLQRAIELEPDAREHAQKDSDFDSIRADERFRSLVAGQTETAG
jgi:tetratricopeptide (TPR) repeat protein